MTADGNEPTPEPAPAGGELTEQELERAAGGVLFPNGRDRSTVGERVGRQQGAEGRQLNLGRRGGQNFR